MNAGLLRKAVRETFVLSVILATGLLTIEIILAAVLPALLRDFSATLLQIEFIRTMISALLGADLGDMMGPAVLSALAWVHPVVLAIMWTLATIMCTRVPAGEVDRGTIDVLFGLPVSRWRVYVAETLVFAATGIVVLAIGLIGHCIGRLFLSAGDRPALGRILVVLVNFYVLYLAVGGLAYLVSAFSDRRGRAIGIVFGLLLASFLLNFLAQFWAPADAVSFLSLLTYYQPLGVLREAGDGIWPVKDLVVLCGFAAVTWAAGAVWFVRRDICTV